MGSVFAMTTTIPVIKGTGKIPGSPIPQNRRQAMKNPFWTGYQAAEGVEMELHRVNGTWKYVPLSSVPVDKIILDTKWVYDDKIEIDAKGEPYITRLKARLTAMGNFQRKGIDYQDVFASVMRGQSLRLLLLIRLLHASHRMEKWDAKAAFINAVLKPEDEIYIKQPAGHEVPGTEGMVCRLVKALYGLHQSAAAWQDHLNVYFKKAGV